GGRAGGMRRPRGSLRNLCPPGCREAGRLPLWRGASRAAGIRWAACESWGKALGPRACRPLPDGHEGLHSIPPRPGCT
ncbi:hypothetical protein P7K49_017135, partial [Saguinus oedipus]